LSAISADEFVNLTTADKTNDFTFSVIMTYLDMNPNKCEVKSSVHLATEMANWAGKVQFRKC